MAYKFNNQAQDSLSLGLGFGVWRSSFAGLQAQGIQDVKVGSGLLIKPHERIGSDRSG